MTNSVVSDVPSTSNYQNKNNFFSLLSQLPCLHLPHQKKKNVLRHRRNEQRTIIRPKFSQHKQTFGSHMLIPMMLLTFDSSSKSSMLKPPTKQP